MNRAFFKSINMYKVIADSISFGGRIFKKGDILPTFVSESYIGQLLEIQAISLIGSTTNVVSHDHDLDAE